MNENGESILKVQVDNDLHLQTENRQVVVSSRIIAERFGKRHDHVLRTIESTLENDSTQNWGQYFITNQYKDVSGKSNKEYLLTRDGFTLVVMGFTGKEALRWKLKYIEAFNKLEQAINAQPMCIEDLIIANAKALKETREQAELATLTALEAKQEIQSMREVMTLDPTAWRKETTNIINKIAQKLGGNENIQAIRKESYELLEIKAKAQLGIRLTNMKRKVLEETGSKSRADKVTKLDVIDSDGRLKEIYISIVKEMAIKYSVA